MGIIRKTMSIGTAGLVDFRSDKERTARYTRHTRNAVRAQSKQQAKLARTQTQFAAQQAAAAQASAQYQAAQYSQALAAAQQPQAIAPAQMAAGWYADPWLPGGTRWWDGQQWTSHTAPPA